MKKISIITICLLSAIAEGQQQQPAKNDSSYTGIKSSLHSLLTNVKQAKKLAAKKVHEVKQEEDVMQQVQTDTVLIDLNYDDSMRIYSAIKEQVEQETQTPEPKKKPTGIGKVLRSVFHKKSK